MTDNVNLPRQNSSVTEGGAPATREWYNFFRRLTDQVNAGDTGGSSSGGTGDTTIINNLFAEPTIQDASTARLLSYGDAFRLIEFTNASAVTVTVPTVLSVPFPSDTIIYLTQGGAGQVTVVADAGVTIDKSDSLKTRTQESTIGLKMIQPDKWQLFGDSEPVAPAKSVLIRSAGTAGVPAFVSPTAEGQVLKQVSGALVFAAESGGGGSGNSYMPGGW